MAARVPAVSLAPASSAIICSMSRDRRRRNGYCPRGDMIDDSTCADDVGGTIDGGFGVARVVAVDFALAVVGVVVVVVVGEALRGDGDEEVLCDVVSCSAPHVGHVNVSRVSACGPSIAAASARFNHAIVYIGALSAYHERNTRGLIPSRARRQRLPIVLVELHLFS
jgi:hypothetical protein